MLENFIFCWNLLGLHLWLHLRLRAELNMQIQWNRDIYWDILVLFTIFFFPNFCSVVSCWTPHVPTTPQDDMRLERRRCIQVSLFSRAFIRENLGCSWSIFCFHSFLYNSKIVIANLVEYLRTCRIFKICFFALLDFLQLAKKESGFCEWKYCVQSFMKQGFALKNIDYMYWF